MNQGLQAGHICFEDGYAGNDDDGEGYAQQKHQQERQIL